jgi:uncharacterized membrane protein YkvA (DUF1232 family)
MSNKPGNLLVPPRGGTLKQIVNRLKLIGRLMADPRVNLWLKLIPLGTLVYLISPIDAISGIPLVSALDDTALLWLGSYLFVELCPPDVVQEHTKALRSSAAPDGEVVEGEATDVTEDNG